ncbi:MAG: hypothetical protein RBR78_06675 [Flavobacteriaceae bacterium]|jgi:hypothetical protein|nr:hypothetical protein [Flavobacteriaceae bacterium]
MSVPKQELIIQEIEKSTKVFNGVFFKGIPLTPLINLNLYWYLIGHKKTGISLRKDTDSVEFIETINNLTDQYFLLKKSSFKKTQSLARNDFKQWLKGFFKKNYLRDIKPDYLIHIESIKYYRYIYQYALDLKSKGNKVAFLIFENDRIEESEGFIYIYMKNIKRPFPVFWNKHYGSFQKILLDIQKLENIYKSLGFPKSLVVEGDVPAQIIAGYLSKKYNFESICYQWGYTGTSVYKIGWRNMPYSLFISWGEFFSESYKKENPSLIMKELGHPLALKNNHSGQKTEDRNYILFAVSKEMNPFINFGDIIKFITVAINFGDNNSSLYKIRLRTHPNFIPNKEVQELLDSSNIEVHNYYEHSLEKSFQNVKYCISVSSTVSLESIAFGCFPLYFKVNDIPLLLHEELKAILKYDFIIDYDEDINKKIVRIDNEVRDIQIDYNKIFKQQCY